MSKPRPRGLLDRETVDMQSVIRGPHYVEQTPVTADHLRSEGSPIASYTLKQHFELGAPINAVSFA